MSKKLTNDLVKQFAEELLVGKRFKSLADIKYIIENSTNKNVLNMFYSETEDTSNFVIYYEIENDDNIYTMCYLKDKSENFYITEV